MNKHFCGACGADDGFYTKDRITGQGEFYYDSSGEVALDNSAYYDALSVTPGKTAYCARCRHPMGKASKFIVEEVRPQ